MPVDIQIHSGFMPRNTFVVMGSNALGIYAIYLVQLQYKTFSSQASASSASNNLSYEESGAHGHLAAV